MGRLEEKFKRKNNQRNYDRHNGTIMGDVFIVDSMGDVFMTKFLSAFLCGS